MPDEKNSLGAEQAPALEKPAQAAPQPAAQAPSKKNKKINRMLAKEIDQKLKELKEKTGNLQSHYAKHLLKEKQRAESKAMR